MATFEGAKPSWLTENGYMVSSTFLCFSEVILSRKLAN